MYTFNATIVCLINPGCVQHVWVFRNLGESYELAPSAMLALSAAVVLSPSCHSLESPGALLKIPLLGQDQWDPNACQPDKVSWVITECNQGWPLLSWRLLCLMGRMTSQTSFLRGCFPDRVCIRSPGNLAEADTTPRDLDEGRLGRARGSQVFMGILIQVVGEPDLEPFSLYLPGWS